MAHEEADRTPATSFYDTPSPLPPGRAGKLIRSAVVTDYGIPAGVRAIRILYHSRSAGGNDVPASGLVLLPPGNPPEGGWPVIAWAHGTTGVARICAPSMMKDLGHSTDWLLPIVRAGFAVVAADYAGLGTDVRHEYTSLGAQASDVINGVKAAREAAPQLSQRWVVDGHSQGGGAAWFVAQQEAVLHDPNYLGAISVAGDMNMPWLMRLGGKQLVAVLRAYGIKARFPQFHVGDMLTKPALAQYRTITTSGCWSYGYAMQLGHLLGRSAVKPRFEENPWVREFVAQNAALRHRPTRPLLVLAGGADHTVPPQSVEQVVAKACRLGYHLQFRIFPGLDHDPLMDKSIAYQLRWIRARFAGRPATDTCTSLIKPSLIKR
ncbi:MAG: alpha/beta fold hydrolase [Steroidobacteraceae bacterium]